MSSALLYIYMMASMMFRIAGENTNAVDNGSSLESRPYHVRHWLQEAGFICELGMALRR